MLGSLNRSVDHQKAQDVEVLGQCHLWCTDLIHLAGRRGTHKQQYWLLLQGWNGGGKGLALCKSPSSLAFCISSMQSSTFLILNGFIGIFGIIVIREVIFII